MKQVSIKSLRRLPNRFGFSLIEVVVAVGIFAIAIVSVIGLLGPINKTVADVRDFDDASRVVNAIQATLQEKGFGVVKGFLDSPPASSNKLYADRTGRIIALDSDDAAWKATNSVQDINGDGAIDDIDYNAQKFFEIELTRNGTLSPNASDDSAGFLAFTITLRWPGYTANGRPFVDESKDSIKETQRAQQSVMVVPAAITR